MPIDATCPGCQAKLRIGDEFAGQQARCPRCDTIYLVPTVSEESTTAFQTHPTAESEAEAAMAGSQTHPTVSEEAELFGTGSETRPTVSEEVAVEAMVAAELPPPDGTQWYLRTPEGPIYGPTSEQNFQRWVIEGRVTPDCLVSPGDHLWRPAVDLFPELSAPRPRPEVRPETLEAARVQPHRGALILLLGIMGIVTTCPIPSIMAWVMGSYDLGEMAAGRMNDAGHGLTSSGRMLGMVFSMIYIGAAVVAMFVLVLVFAQG